MRAVATGVGLLLLLSAPAEAQSTSKSRRDTILRLDRKQRLEEARKRMRDADLARVREAALTRKREDDKSKSTSADGAAEPRPAAGKPGGAGSPGPVSLEAQAARTGSSEPAPKKKPVPGAGKSPSGSSGGGSSSLLRGSDITLESGEPAGRADAVPTVGGQPADLILPYEKPESMLPSRYPKMDRKAQLVVRVIAMGEAEFTGEGNLVIFRRDVSVNHPDFDLKCDVLHVYLNEEGEMERAVATGYVQIVKKGTKSSQIGKARRAIYLPQTEDIELREWPQVQHGKNLHIARAADTKMMLYKNGDMKTFGPSESRVIQSSKSGTAAAGAGSPASSKP